MVDDGAPVAGTANTEPSLPGRLGRVRRHQTWSAPEVVAVVLLSVLALSVAGFVDTESPLLGGWRSTLSAWTGWAVQVWLPIVLLLTALVGWYCATTTRDELLGAGESRHASTEAAEQPQDSYPGALELWSRERRAVVISALTALFGAVASLSVILAVISTEWPGPSQGFVLYASRLAAILLGLASLLPCLATMVIFRHVYGIWSDMVAADEPSNDPADRLGPSSGRAAGPDSPVYLPRRRL